jgi:hypothetical protein
MKYTYGFKTIFLLIFTIQISLSSMELLSPTNETMLICILCKKKCLPQNKIPYACSKHYLFFHLECYLNELQTKTTNKISQYIHEAPSCPLCKKC